MWDTGWDVTVVAQTIYGPSRRFVVGKSICADAVWVRASYGRSVLGAANAFGEADIIGTWSFYTIQFILLLQSHRNGSGLVVVSHYDSVRTLEGFSWGFARARTSIRVQVEQIYVRQRHESVGGGVCEELLPRVYWPAGTYTMSIACDTYYLISWRLRRVGDGDEGLLRFSRDCWRGLKGFGSHRVDSSTPVTGMLGEANVGLDGLSPAKYRVWRWLILLRIVL